MYVGLSAAVVVYLVLCTSCKDIREVGEQQLASVERYYAICMVMATAVVVLSNYHQLRNYACNV